jgi:translocator protein
MKKINYKVLIVSLVIVYLVAFLGSLFTSPVTDSDWYEEIKPSITPPGFVFPIVWNILFFMIGLSLYFAWVGVRPSSGYPKLRSKGAKMIALVFGINLVLNILWSVLYFGLKNPMLAFFELIFLEASIIWMIYVSGKVDKKAGWLLVPYALWVGFAGVLNYLTVF